MGKRNGEKTAKTAEFSICYYGRPPTITPQIGGVEHGFGPKSATQVRESFSLIIPFPVLLLLLLLLLLDSGWPISGSGG